MIFNPKRENKTKYNRNILEGWTICQTKSELDELTGSSRSHSEASFSHRNKLPETWRENWIQWWSVAVTHCQKCPTGYRFRLKPPGLRSRRRHHRHRRRRRCCCPEDLRSEEGNTESQRGSLQSKKSSWGHGAKTLLWEESPPATSSSVGECRRSPFPASSSSSSSLLFSRAAMSGSVSKSSSSSSSVSEESSSSSWSSSSCNTETTDESEPSAALWYHHDSINDAGDHLNEERVSVVMLTVPTAALTRCLGFKKTIRNQLSRREPRNRGSETANYSLPQNVVGTVYRGPTQSACLLAQLARR